MLNFPPRAFLGVQKYSLASQAGTRKLSQGTSPADAAPKPLGLLFSQPGVRDSPPEGDPFHPWGDLLSDGKVGPWPQPN